jgi:hypothetical protein
MQERHQALHTRLQDAFMALQHTEDIRARSTLWKFYHTARTIWTELDKEMVNCRRRNTVTPKYADLERLFEEHLSIFEQWITMSALIHT